MSSAWSWAITRGCMALVILLVLMAPLAALAQADDELPKITQGCQTIGLITGLNGKPSHTAKRYCAASTAEAVAAIQGAYTGAGWGFRNGNCTVATTSVLFNCTYEMYSSYWQSGTLQFMKELSCPANSTSFSSTTCKCSAGFTFLNDKCVPDNCSAGRTLASGYFAYGTRIDGRFQNTGCFGGCFGVFSGTVPAGSELVNGVKTYYGFGEFHDIGVVCEAGTGPGQSPPGPTTTPTVPPPTCAPGQVLGTVNGKPYCAAGGSGGGGSGGTGTDPGSGGGTGGGSGDGGDGGDGGSSGGGTGGGDGSGGDGSGGGGGGTGTPAPLPEGHCSENPNAAECVGSPVEPGELYSENEQTIQGIIAARSNQIAATPIGQAMGGFFVVPEGGSCPSWEWNIPYLNESTTFDFFCKPFAVDAFAILRICVLFMAAFMAFRIMVH